MKFLGRLRRDQSAARRRPHCSGEPAADGIHDRPDAILRLQLREGMPPSIQTTSSSPATWGWKAITGEQRATANRLTSASETIEWEGTLAEVDRAANRCRRHGAGGKVVRTELSQSPEQALEGAGLSE
jgi:hypothetical protein